MSAIEPGRNMLHVRPARGSLRSQGVAMFPANQTISPSQARFRASRMPGSAFCLASFLPDRGRAGQLHPIPRGPMAGSSAGRFLTAKIHAATSEPEKE